MRYGFIGCGSMGGALALAASRVTKDIMLTGKTASKCRALAEQMGVSAGSNSEAAEKCDFLFIGVKPDVVKSVLEEISETVKRRKSVIISMAAGVTLEQINEYLGEEAPIIRIMPNTPVSVGKGVVLYCKNGVVTEKQENEFKEALKYAGWLTPVDEKKMNAGCAVSGCGPAYVFQMIEAMADGAVKCGLKRDDALTLSAQTLVGAASLMLETGEHPGVLKDKVCSPGGSTIEGVLKLKSRGFEGAVAEAVIAAYNKNEELGKRK